MVNPFLIVRLFSDHDYLVSAAGRLGLEAGQGLLDGDIVDNLSSGLETARAPTTSSLTSVDQIL